MHLETKQKRIQQQYQSLALSRRFKLRPKNIIAYLTKTWLLQKSINQIEAEELQSHTCATTCQFEQCKNRS
jgi:hypothetical protein